jgi:hypothetical protein
MSVWTKPCYRSYPYQSVARHLGEEDLKIPFVQRLLDFEIDDTPNLILPHGLKTGNVRSQCEDGYVKASDLIGGACPLEEDKDDWFQEFDKTFEQNVQNRQLREARETACEERQHLLRSASREDRRATFSKRKRTNIPATADKLFAKLLTPLEEPEFGLSGVYHFTARYFTYITSLDRSGAVLTATDELRLQEIIEAGLTGSYISPPASRKYATEYASGVRRAYANVQDFVGKLIKSVVWSGTRKARQTRDYETETDGEYPAVPDNISLPGFICYSAYNLLILEDECSEATYCFTDMDIDRIKRLWTGFALFPVYLEFYGYGEQRDHRHTQLVNSGLRLRNQYLKYLEMVSNQDANSLCRKLDVHLYYVMSKHACDITDDAYKLQLAKLHSVDPDNFREHGYLDFILSQHKIKEQLELLYLYKTLPCPDFCEYTMFQKQLNMYAAEQRPDYGISSPLTGTFEDAKLYHRWLLIFCYYKWHKICPGVIVDVDPESSWQCQYPYVQPHQVPYQQAGLVQFNGVFLYQSYGQDILHAVKDKAICPLAIAEVVLKSDLNLIDPEEKNQLLDVRTRETPIDTDVLKTQRDTIFYDVKLEDKPEAKKPDGRMFMEAHTEARLLQSEYEENIQKYAEFSPGYMAASALPAGRSLAGRSSRTRGASMGCRPSST